MLKDERHGKKIIQQDKIKRCKHYTEKLYKRDERIADFFKEISFEEQPAILEGLRKLHLGETNHQELMEY